jgi:mannose-1-phosphate guanylyltransferase
MTHNQQPWAVILAGGDGIRLQPLTQLVCGDNRPKQFCPLFGGESLLAETRNRVARLVSPERTLLVLTKDHEPFYAAELDGIEAPRLVIQPENKGTAAAMLYSLLRIARTGEDGIVAFLPSDHYYSEDSPFLTSLEHAVRIAQSDAHSIVLLGAVPQHPEVEYGWIEPGVELADYPGRCSRVNRFWEKPSLEFAQKLLGLGCLWNTFVMVGRATAFLQIIRALLPEMHRAFDPLTRLTSGDFETETARRVYRTLAPADFSRQVLSKSAERLVVLRLDDTCWSDLGKPERVMATLNRTGIMPSWTKALAVEA